MQHRAGKSQRTTHQQRQHSARQAHIIHDQHRQRISRQQIMRRQPHFARQQRCRKGKHQSQDEKCDQAGHGTPPGCFIAASSCAQRHRRIGALRQAAAEQSGGIDNPAMAEQFEKQGMVVLVVVQGWQADIFVAIGQNIRPGGDQRLDIVIAAIGSRDIAAARRLQQRIEQGPAARNKSARAPARHANGARRFGRRQLAQGGIHQRDQQFGAGPRAHRIRDQARHPADLIEIFRVGHFDDFRAAFRQQGVHGGALIGIGQDQVGMNGKHFLDAVVVDGKGRRLRP